LGHGFTQIFTDYIIANNNVIDVKIKQPGNFYNPPCSSILYPVSSIQHQTANSINPINFYPVKLFGEKSEADLTGAINFIFIAGTPAPGN
jgi:hypothetical protein